jgi:hypothetical protein
MEREAGQKVTSGQIELAVSSRGGVGFAMADLVSR